MKKQIYPELQKGIRVRYIDRNEAARDGRIHLRTGNSITIIGGLNQKRRVRIDQIRGYWKPKVKASPENMIQLEEDKQPYQKPSGTHRKKE